MNVKNGEPKNVGEWKKLVHIKKLRKNVSECKKKLEKNSGTYIKCWSMSRMLVIDNFFRKCWWTSINVGKYLHIFLKCCAYV